MKKSEFTQLTQIIEHLVAKEIRKQLPTLIAETFQNMMGKKIVNEQKQPIRQPIQEKIEVPDEEINLKTSLKELFAGTSVMKTNQTQHQQQKVFTKNPVLNQILNETTNDLRQRDRMGGGALGYSPALAMVPGFSPMSTTGAGQMMEEEPALLKNIPMMPGASSMSIPIEKPPMLAEGQESSHAPLSTLPEGLSALDVRNHIPDPNVKEALTRNYSEMMKLIDSKRKGRI